MRIAIVAVAVLAIGALTAVPTAGQQFFTANIDGAQVVPPTGSPATGFGCITLNPNGTVTFDVAFTGLLAAETTGESALESNVGSAPPIGAPAGSIAREAPVGGTVAGLVCAHTRRAGSRDGSGSWPGLAGARCERGGRLRGLSRKDTLARKPVGPLPASLSRGGYAAGAVADQYLGAAAARNHRDRDRGTGPSLPSGGVALVRRGARPGDRNRPGGLAGDGGPLQLCASPGALHALRLGG